MNRFWKIIILPILEEIHARHLVEIGSDAGINTKNILEYCASENAHLTSVDPFPKFNVEQFKSEYGDKFEFFKELSISRLPLINDYDALLIDGDHNWYTVFNELKIVEKKFKAQDFPIIFLNGTGLPYGRRDLYHYPENIPDEYRQPYEKSELNHGNEELNGEELNPHSYDSIIESTPKNGVLTAVEDYIAESELELSFNNIPIYEGLGILYPMDEELKNTINSIINDVNLLDVVEEERSKTLIENKSFQGEIIGNEYHNDLQMKVETPEELDQKEKIVMEKENKLHELDNKLKKTETILYNTENKLNDTENFLEFSKDLIQKKDNILIEIKKKDQKQLDELSLQINVASMKLFEMGYSNANNRTLIQRLISKIPRLIILFKSKGLKKAIINIKGYNQIKKNHLFNLGYYLRNNPDVRYSGKDPLLHYLFNGYKEGRNPNPKFDGKYYLEKYSDVNDSNLNPLIHYSLYGIKERRKTIEHKTGPKIEFIKHSSADIDAILKASNQKISIIITAYDGFSSLKQCVDNVTEYTKNPYEIFIVHNDNNSEVIKSLEGMEELSNITVLNETSIAKNINHAIEKSNGDLVLLNSDTMVTPKWLQKLILAAYGDKKVGTVTPLSNNPGTFSIPEICLENQPPTKLTLEELSSRVEKISGNFYPEVPSGSSYCMFIKRETITDTGLFDDKNFNNGSFIEKDFCMRANKKLWKNIVDDSTYVYNIDNVSSHKVSDAGRKIFNKKYPSYKKLVKEFIKNKKYSSTRNNLKKAFKSGELSQSGQKRILYVLHSASGGTPATNEDLMGNIQEEMDCYVLTSSANEMKLWMYKNSTFKWINTWKIKSKWYAKDFYNPIFRDIYFDILTDLKIDLVHIRHLIKHSFDLPEVAKTIGVPYIISFHDFYFICPSHNLIDGNGNYCAGQCTEGDEECMVNIEMGDMHHIKEFVHVWRTAVSKILKDTAALVTTSEIIKQLYITIYPELSKKEFRVIEHGRDFDDVEDLSNLYEVPSKNKPIKILFPGNINKVKGSEFIMKIKDADHDKRLEFHFIGAIASESSDLKDYGIYHGTYERNDFCRLVGNIKPSFIGILSMWPETYCHTLTEAWSCGVPVLASKIGVLEERVNNNGGGWLLDYQDPLLAYNKIIEVADDADGYVEVAENVINIKFRTTKEMAEGYMELYTKYLSEKKTAMLKPATYKHNGIESKIKKILKISPCQDVI